MRKPPISTFNLRPSTFNLQPSSFILPMTLPRNPTRAVRIGSVTIGDANPVAVQSMTATRTQDVEATTAQVNASLRALSGVSIEAEFSSSFA